MQHGQVLATALAWMQAGHRVALATVTRTQGSSPRPLGSQLAVREDGRFVGSVSGGCVEAVVIATALEVLAEGRPQTLEFGVDEDTGFDVRLACGGTIQVDVTPAMQPVLDHLESRRTAREEAWAVLDREHGRWCAVDREATDSVGLPKALLARIQTTADPTLIETDDGSWMVLPVAPSIRVILIGAVHIADTLVRISEAAGYWPILVDPRQAFADPERFPGATVRCQWPQEALPELGVDARTAIVTLTHDAKIDDPALALAIESDAFYIGALGSRKTHAARRERLKAAGHREDAIDRIHGPVGVSIGSRTPAEIAVSIAAQIIERRRCGVRPRVAVMILAAGRSTRAGETNKLLHPFEGSSMLERAVGAAVHSRAQDVVVVTGHDADRVRAQLGDRPIRIVHNPDYAKGMSASIQIGIDAVRDADGVIVQLADMPWVTTAHIDALVAAFSPQSGPCILVPTYEEQRGNPVLWSRHFFPELRGLTGDRGGKPVLQRHSDCVKEIAIPDDGVLRDVDTLP